MGDKRTEPGIRRNNGTGVYNRGKGGRSVHSRQVVSSGLLDLPIQSQKTGQYHPLYSRRYAVQPLRPRVEQKGFIAIDEDGNIHLTSEGRRLTIDLEPYDLMFELGGDRFNPGAILLGHTTGRKLMTAFEQWITETVGDILKYVPKEDNQAAATQESDTFPAQPEK